MSTRLKEVYGHAMKCGVKMAIEPLNRYETYFLNRGDQALALAKEVGPECGVCLDLFHMNIEEVDMFAAIRQAGKKLYDVHVAENNRLAPGMGNVDWAQAGRDAARSRLRRRAHDGSGRWRRSNAGHAVEKPGRDEAGRYLRRAAQVHPGSRQQPVVGRVLHDAVRDGVEDVAASHTMKIRDVEAVWLHCPLPETKQHTSDFGRMTAFDGVIVTIRTDDGLVGYGEAKAGVGSAGNGARARRNH